LTAWIAPGSSVVAPADGLVGHLDAVGERVERGPEAVGRVHQQDAVPGLELQLPAIALSAVAGA
jgi:predicted deacylase